MRESFSALRVVVVGVKWTGVGAIRAALSRVGVNIVWMFAAYAAGTAVAAIPWRELFPASARVRRGARRSTSRFAASGLNALVPFFGLGEAARLLWLPRGERSPGLAALVVDRLLFLAAGTPILLLAALAAHARPRPSRAATRWRVLISAAIISIAVARVAAGAARGRLVGKLRWALVLFGVPPIRAGSGGRRRATASTRSTAGCAAADRDRARRIAGGFALHLCARLLLAAEIYAGLRILGAHVGLLGDADLHRDPDRAVGGRHVRARSDRPAGRASALVAAALGIGPATGIALVFLQRLRQLVFVPLAGLSDCARALRPP